MKRKLIIVLLLVLGGCTSSNNGTNASELQAKIDEQNIIIKGSVLLFG